MAKLYTYMIGIEPSDWTIYDTKMCRANDIVNKGYYELGNNEGMVLVGTLKDLKHVMENYFGLEIVDDYLCEVDEFDYEDGRWRTGGWNESKKSACKSLKESTSYDDIVFKVGDTMREVSKLGLSSKFGYIFDKNTVCDMIWYICGELNANYQFHLFPKYDHGTQIRVDFIRDKVNVGHIYFDPMIKDTFELTREIEDMLE